MKLQSVSSQNLRSKTVFLRVDFNEPYEKGKLDDSFRIRATLPTIKYLLKRQCRIVLASHLEDQHKRPVPFKKVLSQFEKLLGIKLAYVQSPSERNVTHALTKNKVTIIENLRLFNGEKSNSTVFAKRLASLGDTYINEAFSVSHREHASIVGIPRYLPSYAGPLFMREVEKLSEALHPRRPFFLIVGGAKFETKFALLKQFRPKADAIFLGGVLANTFLAARGVRVGSSIVERDAIPDIRKHFLRSKNILLPVDVRVSNKRGDKKIFEVKEDEFIVDIGKETARMLCDLSESARYVLWNGPLGFTDRGYFEGTKTLIRSLSQKKKGRRVVVGGGDTLSVLGHLQKRGALYHVSTGGGAMLDFLADGTLPGIEALLRSQKLRH